MNYFIKKENPSLKTAFTFIELMVVIAILGLLAGIGVPLFMNKLEQSAKDTTKITLKATAQALDLYKLQIGTYPKRLEDLVEKPKGPDGSKWTSAFMEKTPLDGWKQEFYYKLTPNAKKPYELYSYGKNGPDGASEDRISVWNI